MNDYTPLLIFLVTAFAISSIIVGASYLLSVKTPDAEKVSVYECGFDPFGDSRQKFEVRFFLVGILFIIFDLEISFLFPWSIALHDALMAPVLELANTLKFSNVGGAHGYAIEGAAATTAMADSGYWVVILFLAILTIGLVYEWVKGGLEWE